MLRCILALDAVRHRLAWRILEQGACWNNIYETCRDDRGCLMVATDRPYIGIYSLWLRSGALSTHDSDIQHVTYGSHYSAIVGQRRWLSVLVALSHRLNDVVELRGA